MQASSRALFATAVLVALPTAACRSERDMDIGTPEAVDAGEPGLQLCTN
jgi:hypothetical protein